jgi:SAM-dependent methyltransferase
MFLPETMRPMERALHERWEEQAEAWARWARTPGHDAWHWRYNWPAFVELLPPAGRLTLDLGCGEGRGGIALRELGHRVIGIDAAETMVRLARATGAYEAVYLSDAAALAVEDGAFDLVVAYMSLHDMDDLAGALGEAARVLEPGGRLCAAVVHPLSSAHLGSDDEIPYFEPRQYTDVVARDGIEMAFHGVHRPLEDYFAALPAAGLSVEVVREPCPSDEQVAAFPAFAKARRRPPFLHLIAARR